MVGASESQVAARGLLRFELERSERLFVCHLIFRKEWKECYLTVVLSHLSLESVRSCLGQLKDWEGKYWLKYFFLMSAEAPCCSMGWNLEVEIWSGTLETVAALKIVSFLCFWGLPKVIGNPAITVTSNFSTNNIHISVSYFLA